MVCTSLDYKSTNPMDFIKTIHKVLRNEPLTDREADTLGRWLASGDGRERFDAEVMRELDASFAEAATAHGSVMETISRNLDRRIAGRKKGVRLAGYRRIAAVAAVAVVAVSVWFLGFRDQAGRAHTIPAGGPVATLQLYDGTTVNLADLKNDEIIQQGARTTIRNGEVTYDDTELSDRMAFNRISVPKGGEYKVVLTDGTAVWLNSDSYLQYPLRFTGGKRRVFLEGEAYFEVAHDAGKPFIVETGGQKLTVLGTSFNISAYTDDARTLTTLVTGSVSVVNKASLEERMLVPGQQARLDGKTDLFEIAGVDVGQVLGWKNGLFVFDDQDLWQVMQKLARWYDVEVVFGNEEAKSIVFQGNLPRYNDLGTLLKTIEKISPATFEIKGNTVLVSM